MKITLTLALFASSAIASAESAGLAPQAAISGIAAMPSGNLLVSPPAGAPAGVVEVAADGSLVKTWTYPAGTALEIVDVDPDGRPIGVDIRAGKVWILKPDGSAPDWILLANVKGVDARTLAPVVRAAGSGEVAAIEADGSAVWKIAANGTATKVALAGTHGTVGDLDIAADGTIAVLDAGAGILREYEPTGALRREIPVAAPGAPAGWLPLVIRFVPGSSELWALELPPPGLPVDDTKAACALQRIDSKGVRVLRIDHDSSGTPYPPAAGLAPTKDGVWVADLAGIARKLDAKGAVSARVDAAPPPPGMDWNEKKRLAGVATHAETASLADATAALAVVATRADAERLFARLTSDPAASEPLLIAATAKQTLPPALLAGFYARTQPGTRPLLARAFHHESAGVRVAAVSALRDPDVTGFDEEALAAASDKAPEVRGAALVVLSRHRWTVAMPAVFIAHLGDDDPDVAMLAAQACASRLPDTVEPLVAMLLDPKASARAKELGARAIVLDVPSGERINPLPPNRRAPLQKLVNAESPVLKRVGALALIIHGDPKGPAAIEPVWNGLAPDQKRLAMGSWSPTFGDKGGEVLTRLFGKEKDPQTRATILRALHINGGATSRAFLVKRATTPGSDPRERVLTLELAKRKLSDAQVLALAGELPSRDPDLTRAILALVAERSVSAAAPKIAPLIASDSDRPQALIALYRLGSKEGVPRVLARIKDGKADDVERSYLASVGGLPADAIPSFVEAAKGDGAAATFAAEALARSGNDAGLSKIVAAAKADRYGAGPRDGNIPGALAALGENGRAAAKALMTDPNAATREDAVLALALLGGETCKDVVSWSSGTSSNGVSIPAAFYAVSACGDAQAAAAVYQRALHTTSNDPILQTASPDAFAALLTQTLRQPDFRPKSEVVLSAIGALPRQVVVAVAQALSGDLDPVVVGAAYKLGLFGALRPSP